MAVRSASERCGGGELEVGLAVVRVSTEAAACGGSCEGEGEGVSEKVSVW